MKKRTSKLLSFVLATVMIFISIPGIAFSEGLTIGQIGADDNATLIGSTDSFKEDVALRDAYSKHYILENGERFAVIFPEAVHYKENNEWLEVDNRLTYNSATGKYVSANPKFTTAFSGHADAAELVSVSDGEYTVSWGISFTKQSGENLVNVASRSISPSVANGTDTAEALSAVKKAQTSNAVAVNSTATNTVSAEELYKSTVTDLGKAASSISYSNIMENTVSVRYSVLHGKVEEDIILHSAGDLVSYKLTVNTGGLIANAEAGGRVLFKNAEGETIFTIASPWMSDSENAFSRDITVSVAQSGNTATITYTPSAEWLGAEDRAYPVLIDPSFTTRDFTSNYADTYIMSGERDYTYYEDDQLLQIGSSPVGYWYGYIKILNIPDISEYFFYRITSANLQMWTPYNYNYPLNLNEVTSPWIGATDLSPAPSTNRIVSNISAVTQSDGTYKYTFDLTNFFNQVYHDWGDYTYYWENIGHGFMLSANVTGSDCQTFIRSSEAPKNRPVMTITYDNYVDASLHDDGIYSFKCYGSSMYMSDRMISSGISNICQGDPTLLADETEMSFRLEHIEASNTWRIRAMTSSNGYDKMIGFLYSATASDTGGYSAANVVLCSDSQSDRCTEWIIEPVGGDSLYRIVSAQDPNLALSFYGDQHWNNGYGYSSTTPGNIFVSPYSSTVNSSLNPGQHWQIFSGNTLISDGYDIEAYPTFEMNEGDTATFNVTAYDIDQSVAWSSSNPSVVSVNNGEVAAHRLGAATVTATVTDSSNEVIATYSTVITVVLDNSIYGISHFDRQDYLIQTNPNYPHQAAEYYAAESYQDDRGTIFKIYHLGNGVYSIRSMTDNRYGFTVSSQGNLVHQYIGTIQKPLSENDPDGVPLYAQWIIEGSSDEGYTITSAWLENGSVAMDGGGGLFFSALDGSTIYRWIIWDASYGSDGGIEIDDSINAVMLGDEVYIDAIFYSTDMHQNGQDISWSVDEYMSTGGATINSTTGKLIGSSSGVVKISATYNGIYAAETYLLIYSPTDIKLFRTTTDVYGEFTLCVAELYNGEKYWYQISNSDVNTYSDVLLLSNENIGWLHEKYNAWPIETTSHHSLEYCVYQAKHKLDNAIAANEIYNVPVGSDEYNGLWLYFSLLEAEYRQDILQIVNGINTMTMFVNVAYQAYALSINIHTLANLTTIHNNIQAASGLSAVSSFNSLTSAQAVSEGITDVVTYAASRPTWLQSEAYAAATRFQILQGYRYNRSYIKNGTGIQEVHWGTKDSVRPDFYNETTKHCVDIKNYTITTSDGRNSLVYNVVNQYNQRVAIFPSDTSFEVVIDVRGQAWTQEMLDDVMNRIILQTGGKMIVSFIK